MKIPFDLTQFITVFRNYNESIGPTPFVLSFIALLLLLLIGKKKETTRLPLFFLSFIWAWTGIVYHWIFFSTINPLAKIFGIFFVIQAIAFLIYSLLLKDRFFELRKNCKSIVGIFMVMYAVVIYPALGFPFGHIYPDSPSFGAPCPSTIYTLGLLMLLAKKPPVWLYVIPLLWAVIGFNAALSFSIYEDYGLLLSGIIFLVYMIKKTKNSRLMAQ